MLSTNPHSFGAHYKSLVSSGTIEADPAQQEAAEALAALEQRLAGYKPLRKQGLMGRLLPTRTSRRRAASTFMATLAVARPC